LRRLKPRSARSRQFRTPHKRKKAPDLAMAVARSGAHHENFKDAKDSAS